MWEEVAEAPPAPDERKGETRAAIEKLDEKITESTDLIAVRFYGLGEYELSRGPKAPKEKTKLIDGSADATQWNPSKMKEGRYKKIASYASVLLDILDTDPDRLTPKTRDFLLPKKDILTLVASLKPSEFPEKLEKQYSFDEVSGPEGIYNIIVAFQRIVNLYGKSAKTLAKDVKIKLALSIGEHVKEEKERFAKAYGEEKLTVLEAELGGSALRKEPGSKVSAVIEEVLRTTAPTSALGARAAEPAAPEPTSAGLPPAPAPPEREPAGEFVPPLRTPEETTALEQELTKINNTYNQLFEKHRQLTDRFKTFRAEFEQKNQISNRYQKMSTMHFYKDAKILQKKHVIYISNFKIFKEVVLILKIATWDSHSKRTMLSMTNSSG